MHATVGPAVVAETVDRVAAGRGCRCRLFASACSPAASSPPPLLPSGCSRPSPSCPPSRTRRSLARWTTLCRTAGVSDAAARPLCLLLCLSLLPCCCCLCGAGSMPCGAQLGSEQFNSPAGSICMHLAWRRWLQRPAPPVSHLPPRPLTLPPRPASLPPRSPLPGVCRCRPRVC